ncbi:MAG: ferrous iron transport protein B [Candidatus Altiarchaeota archaeon]|nr:ferrous iron transport protein B [Candidatus Altiarchaeota archaeon]
MNKEFTVALVGNPNVGKSCFFNQLTGLGVVCSNFPGTTVELCSGRSRMHGKEFSVVDLPGVYSLKDASPDEAVVREYLLTNKPDVVINIVDANLLERNLYFTLQLLELNVPLIIALNFHEEARDQGILVDEKKLEKLLGAPVFLVDAVRGSGIHELMKFALEYQKKKKEFRVPYDDHIEKAIEETSGLSAEDIHIPKRAFSLYLLENYGWARRRLRRRGGRRARSIISKYSKEHDLPVDIVKQRYGQAAFIADSITNRIELSRHFRHESLDRLTTEPLSGTMIMVLVLLGIFSALFFFGGLLEGFIGSTFEQFVAPPLNSLFGSIQNEALQETLRYSLVLGIEAGLSVAIPYIFIFYLMMALLEDSGYLTRMGYILDRLMHRLGLHGKAMVPMMVGFGCSVPAIMATRTLQSTRERILTAILISFIPCSARTAVILGAVGFYLGWGYALLIYGILLAIILSVGFILGKKLPGERMGLIMEMPRYRRPSARNVLKKTWMRVKEFVYMAFPFIIIGSGILGFLSSLNLLEPLVKPFDPLVSGWLMLPSAAGITLVYGILRKEMALTTLIVLGGSYDLLTFMTPLQIFVFTLVIAIYVPCIATIAVLGREFGWKRAMIISFFTILTAIVIGGLVARVMPILGLLA